ncbi:MAG TPA: aspartate kinase [Spirochaetia bacterium]|nr:aspartate kinase [Spirochaetia bacterium]
MKIMKFGGTSVQDAARLRTTAQIILEESKRERVAIVLSAMRGVTDSLIHAAREAERGGSRYLDLIQAIADRHETAIDDLLPNAAAGAGGSEESHAAVRSLLEDLRNILRGVELIRECSVRSMDLIMSFGERLNCTLAAAYLRSLGLEADYVDARSMIVTDDAHGHAEVDYEATNPAVRRRLEGVTGIPIITGFIAATPGGATTTLGRDGSDYTASIIGAALRAEIIEIWTDVDGVLSADPRLVEHAFVVPALSFQDAMELSYFGAKVIHPGTMIPAVREDIPIRIRNTFHPEAPGTLISKSAARLDKDITGIASIENVALINVEGGGMIGVRGVASRVFKALADADVNVIMISQASSEHSICLVCRESEAQAAVKSLERELVREVRAGKVERFQVLTDLEIVAVIGENMRGTPGISGRLFSALGEEKINVLAIAQGSSERNISFVVARSESKRALNTVHAAFLEQGGKR